MLAFLLMFFETTSQLPHDHVSYIWCMKIIKMLGLSVVVAFGVFLFIYGGYDDSPGAQGLGVVIVALGVWGEYRLTRSR
ncbi:MAG: hypothetical protein RL538_95 [Candidatus Parcubacteria bacterium]